jgi:hypothetical protein
MGWFIPDPDFYPSRIFVKKPPDPGSATLVFKCWIRILIETSANPYLEVYRMQVASVVG